MSRTPLGTPARAFDFTRDVSLNSVAFTLRFVPEGLDLLLFLCGLPLLVGSLVIVVLPTALAMLGPYIVRKRVKHSQLVKNNEVAGFKFATIGVIYAVLLAFAIVAVWDKFSEAEMLVLQEAGASASLYRISAGKDPEAEATRAALVKYLDTVIEEDWPAMAAEKESHAATKALDSLYAAAIALADDKPQAIGGEIMKEVASLTQARRGRLHLSMGSVPMALWIMLVGGALLTVGFTYFFGLENLRAQSTMTAGLASIIFLGLFVIISYDHPFTGDVSVEAHPLKQVLENFRDG